MRYLQQTIEACRQKAQAHVHSPFGAMEHFLGMKHPFQQTKHGFNQKYAKIPLIDSAVLDGSVRQALLEADHNPNEPVRVLEVEAVARVDPDELHIAD